MLKRWKEDEEEKRKKGTANWIRGGEEPRKRTYTTTKMFVYDASYNDTSKKNVII